MQLNGSRNSGRKVEHKVLALFQAWAEGKSTNQFTSTFDVEAHLKALWTLHRIFEEQVRRTA